MILLRKLKEDSFLYNENKGEIYLLIGERSVKSDFILWIKKDNCFSKQKAINKL